MSGDWRAQDGWAELEAGGGIAGETLLSTPLGMRAAADLCIGDRLRTSLGGSVMVIATRQAANLGWTRLPPMALNNRQEMVVASGQSLLIESSYAARMFGSAAVVLPALALHHWRGIGPCTPPAQSIRLTLARPALIFGGTGVMLAASGPANSPSANLIGTRKIVTGDLPPVTNLSLQSARQLVACLIAYEAGQGLRGFSAYAAAFCAPKRP